MRPATQHSAPPPPVGTPSDACRRHAGATVTAASLRRSARDERWWHVPLAPRCTVRMFPVPPLCSPRGCGPGTLASRVTSSDTRQDRLRSPSRPVLAFPSTISIRPYLAVLLTWVGIFPETSRPRRSLHASTMGGEVQLGRLVNLGTAEGHPRNGPKLWRCEWTKYSPGEWRYEWQYDKAVGEGPLSRLVGARGFEPPTS